VALKKPGDIFKHPQAKPVFTNLSNIEEQLSKAEVLLPKEKVEELKKQIESVSNSIDTSLSEVSDGNVDFSVVRKELDRFNTKITHIEEDLNEKVDDLRRKHTDIKTGIQIVQTRQNNIHPERLKEEVIHRVKNILIGNIGENIRQLEERVDVIKGSYKQTLNEGLLNEPPNVKNSDPLTPLDKKFVTLDEFQSHYKLFINRIQTQLATLGGGGAVNIREMDDVDLTTARVNGKYLKYNSTTNKWEGADGGGGSALTIQDEGSSLSTAATTLNFVGAGVSASGTGATKTINISGGGGGGSQNLFQTIAVSGQDNVVADSTTDTLTFVGGVGIAITTNAASDTVSFASTVTQLTTEEVQDIVGGMFSGNTETNITATYQDDDGTIDLVASGALATRTTTTATTGSIAQAASTNITIPTAGKTFSLLKLAINAPAWVVLYIDSASRTSDASRTEGTDPAPGSGVITEVSTTTSGASTFNMTPAVVGWNNDGTPAAQVYAKVVNKRATSGSNTITVTLTNLALEA
jgi:hypothetical protein